MQRLDGACADAPTKPIRRRMDRREKMMRHILAAILVASVLPMTAATSAMAQDRPTITVRPYGDGAIGDNAYVGPYGRSLPGVSMFAGRAAPVAPVFAYGGVKVPSYQKIENEQTYSQSTLPILDGWHGTLGPGFAF